ncbi:MAG: hypothetical protein A2Z72_03345 [Omnitrophica bacterium RBG_13_46_9]|nr:MAG: hypothetical protein A2Z72_03345 [Omnitrophica bacterium RBG_13_46_9]
MEIILFLVGMMILVGFLKEIGLFTWLLQRVIIIKNISAKKLMATLIFTSGIMACLVDEVSSILFMIMVILEISDFFEINPIPFVISSILATNIGSAGTVMGNPIGILIAVRAQLTFEDFMKYSFPFTILSLLLLLVLLLIIFKKELKELNEKIDQNTPNDILIKLLSVPAEKNMKVGLIVFVATIILISIHHRLELFLGLEKNTVLLIAPLLSSSIIMVWRRQRARSYIEKEVEWWSLLFLIFLFAQAGVLAETGVAEIIAKKSLLIVPNNKVCLVTAVLFGSAFVSSVLDNIVVVAGFMPVMHTLNEILNMKNILWWTLLFGACFGGNITIIGSTANIVAIGALEKKTGKSIDFFYWLKIGFVVGVATLVFILCALLIMPYYE